MVDTWERRIARADELAQRGDAASPLLRVYAQLLRLQADAYADLFNGRDTLTGDLTRDIDRVRACTLRMLPALTTIAPPPIVNEARRLLDAGNGAIDETLIAGWRAADPGFAARLALQPYAECLARAGRRPEGRTAHRSGAACPVCAGLPQLSALHGESAHDGGGRTLQCAMCATVWPFRRVLCAHCGEEDEHQLGYFHAPEFDHVRVDVCERCGHYVKTIDLTRLGHAVPLVDEVASGSLDVWARDRGYQKIAPNLVGL